MLMGCNSSAFGKRIATVNKCRHSRVARVMRAAGLQGVSRRKGCWTTRRDKDARPAPDLVQREFVSDAPDRL